MTMGIPRKQRATHEQFTEAMANIENIITRDHVEKIARGTVWEIIRKCLGKRVAFAWSGGKDSVVLEQICYDAKIKACVFGMTNLEFPAFLKWVTNHMPDGLEVINTGHDLDWLAENQGMLFPQDSKTASKWFHVVQHMAQATYYRKHNLDLLMLGRRHADGNFVGRNHETSYTSKGITRYSPIAAWSHEEVLAFIHYRKIPLPPTYGWPRGYRVGTGPWPARQWTGSIMKGWREVWQIDPYIVRTAAKKIPSARVFLRANGLGL